MNPHRARYEQLSRELRSIENRQRFLSEMGSRFDVELSRWMVDTEGQQHLSKNDRSNVHKLVEAIAGDRYFSSMPVDPTPEGLSRSSVFVVSHDWAAAFGDSLSEHETSVRLPFDSCIFEFVVNGKTAILWAVDITDSINGMLFVPLGDLGWMGFDIAEQKDQPVVKFLVRQLVAICVSLDAEIATTEVVQSPAKLNVKRSKQGKAPLADYRVIDLAKRHRAQATVLSAQGEGRHKRLHFRRGHWRHYSSHKTWIKWQLVGDPDLGFIQSQYRI
jgi:hypothetical protein